MTDLQRAHNDWLDPDSPRRCRVPRVSDEWLEDRRMDERMEMMAIENIDIGNVVMCDLCGKDFTLDTSGGGYLFGTKGVGPCCAETLMKDIIKYEEQHLIRGVCPGGVSFRDWVVGLRGGNNTITILTGEDASRQLRYPDAKAKP